MTPQTRARVVWSAVAVALLATPPRFSLSAQEPPPQTVLALYWSSESFPGTPQLDEAIQHALRAGSDRIDFFSEYLESDRFPEEEATLALRDYIQRKYRGRRIDAVIAVTDVALQFVLRFRSELFPDAPIVTSTIAAPDASVRNSGHGVAAVVYGAGLGETLRLALKLHPSTRRVSYVAEASDAAFEESMANQLRAVTEHVDLMEINESSIARLVAAIKAVPRDSLILYIRYVHDEAGNVLYHAEIAPIVAQAASVPVYGSNQSYLGSGVVGGMVMSRDVVAARLGNMTRAVLRGARPQDMPLEYPPLVPMFDWRQLQRWGIRENMLPPNSVVLFRRVSVWDQYKSTIVVTASVLVLQSLLIAGLVIERRRRRRAEIDSRRHLVAMAHLDRRAAMGELATSLAHELNQPLNAILQNAGVAQMLLASNPVPPSLGEIGDILRDIRKDDIRASEVIRRMRGLLQKHDLEDQPVHLNDVVHDTIAIVWADARSREVELVTELADGLHPVLGDRVHLQQVLLNLLMNAMDAVGGLPPERRRVRVSTTQTAADVRLAVIDTGAGIPADQLTKIFEPFYTTKSGGGMGMGLAIARSIVEAHGGRMGAGNNDGGGATVWFSLPVSPAQAS